MDQAVETKESSSTELAIVQTTLTEFDKISAGLAELTTKYDKAVFAVATTEGMTLAKAARQEIRAPRYATENARKAAKTKILALGKNVDERAAQINAALTVLEDPIHAQIQAEEKRKEDERAARAKTEQERLARIQAAIGDIKDYAVQAAGYVSSQIAELMEPLEKQPIAKDVFFEFVDIAEAAKVATMNKLLEMHTAAVAREEAAAKLKLEQEELRRRQAEQEERERAEAARLAQESVQRDAEDRARREALAAEEAAAKARIETAEREAAVEREAADRKAKSEREAEEARIRAEADRLAKERQAKEERDRKAQEATEAKAKAKRDKEEAAERERQRKATELMDARQMLEAFVTRFGHIKEFASVVKAIEACLVKERKAA